jgi:N4-gp56 family major capsid protein
MFNYRLNLQLFATNTLTALSNENKTYYDMTLLDEAQANLVFNQFGQKRPIPANNGTTINFRKYGALPKATTALTEGITPAGKTLSVSKIEATVQQYGDFVELSDVLDFAAIDNNIVEATKLIGRQAGLTLDTLTRNVLIAGTNVYRVGSKASRSALTNADKLTVAEVTAAVSILKAQNAPKINGEYVAVIHPFVSHDLMQDEAWIDVHKYAKADNIFNGEIGKIAGVRFIESTEAKIFYGTADSCGDKIAVFGCLFLGDGAYGITEITGGGLKTIIKQLGSSGSADPLDQRATVGWKATHVAKILNDAYMLRVECGSSMGGKVTAAN